MKYAILVHPQSNWQSSQHQARKLCDALVSNGAEILAVLFFGDATKIATQDSVHHWNDWDQGHCPLLICSTLDNELNEPHFDKAPFIITGMARWMQLSEQADHVVTIP